MEIGKIALYLVSMIVAAVSMEGAAWFIHKYVMHGFLWVLHEDHHKPKKRGWEKNDLFVLFFSIFAAALFVSGGLFQHPILIWIASGVTLYGIGYFLFHDVMFHHRISWLNLKPTTHYLRRIIHAHSVHHQNSRKHQGISFGFLYAPPKYDVG